MTTINVTAKHIAEGKRENCERCPVALAARAAFPNATTIEVTGSFLGMSHGERYFETRLPVEAGEFIWDFDAGEPVQPFSFELDYPAVTS